MIEKTKSNIEATLLYPKALLFLGRKAVARTLTLLSEVPSRFDSSIAKRINSEEEL